MSHLLSELFQVYSLAVLSISILLCNGHPEFCLLTELKSTLNKQLLLFPPLSILVATILFSVSTLKYLTRVGPFGTCILDTGLSQCSSELQHMMRSV